MKKLLFLNLIIDHLCVLLHQSCNIKPACCAFPKSEIRKLILRLTLVFDIRFVFMLILTLVEFSADASMKITSINIY